MAAREVMEEANLTVAVTALLDVVDSITRDDAAEAIWADPRDLDGYTLWDETLRIIALALERRG